MSNSLPAEYIEYVASHLTEREKLEGLAEELAELIQAALKLIRAKGLNSNNTTTTSQQAVEIFREELTDVMMCLTILNIPVPTENEIKGCYKWERWAKRLGFGE